MTFSLSQLGSRSFPPLRESQSAIEFPAPTPQLPLVALPSRAPSLSVERSLPLFDPRYRASVPVPFVCMGLSLEDNSTIAVGVSLAVAAGIGIAVKKFGPYLKEEVLDLRNRWSMHVEDNQRNKIEARFTVENIYDGLTDSNPDIRRGTAKSVYLEKLDSDFLKNILEHSDRDTSLRRQCLLVSTLINYGNHPLRDIDIIRLARGLALDWHSKDYRYCSFYLAWGKIKADHKISNECLDVLRDIFLESSLKDGSANQIAEEMVSVVFYRGKGAIESFWRQEHLPPLYKRVMADEIVHFAKTHAFDSNGFIQETTLQECRDCLKTPIREGWFLRWFGWGDADPKIPGVEIKKPKDSK